jgi:hypothetical protein
MGPAVPMDNIQSSLDNVTDRVTVVGVAARVEAADTLFHPILLVALRLE